MYGRPGSMLCKSKEMIQTFMRGPRSAARQTVVYEGTPIAHALLSRFVFRRFVMKRETRLLAALVFVLGAVPLICAQNLRSQPSPVLPSDILGPQLIAWSQLQKPQPVPPPLPPPLPPPDRPVQKPDQQTAQPANPQAQPQPPAAQTFTGTIIKDGSRYILKLSSKNVYQLDDQEKAQRYEGKQVKIEGTLDASGNSLHITSIQLLS